MAQTEEERREYQRRYYSENRERLLAQNRDYRARRRDGAQSEANRLNLYGLTPDEFDRMLADQDGRCAVCRQPPSDGRWHVDHDHDCCPGRRACGQCVRGLLCRSCNLGLGCLGENWETLLAAAFYLIEGEERRLLRPADALLDRNLRLVGDV